MAVRHLWIGGYPVPSVHLHLDEEPHLQEGMALLDQWTDMIYIALAPCHVQDLLIVRPPTRHDLRQGPLRREGEIRLEETVLHAKDAVVPAIAAIAATAVIAIELGAQAEVEVGIGLALEGDEKERGTHRIS